MATIRRGTIASKYVDSLKLDILNGKNPSDTSDKVVLTYDYSNANYANIVLTASATNATSATIYTTPSDRDFYLTSASLAFIKDATSTSVAQQITATIGGLATSILNLPGITLTAQTLATSISFSTPIKIDRGTIIAVQNSTNVANIKTSAQISGFLVDG